MSVKYFVKKEVDPEVKDFWTIQYGKFPKYHPTIESPGKKEESGYDEDELMDKEEFLELKSIYEVKEFYGAINKNAVKAIVIYTDTLGGEPNFSWVTRKEFELFDGENDYSIMRKAKYLVGLNGVKGKKENIGDTIKFTPNKSNTAMFIEFE